MAQPNWITLALTLAAIPAVLLAETQPPAYVTDFEKGLDGQPFVQLSEQTTDGKTARYITLRFRVRRTDGKPPDAADRVLIQEDGQTVAEVELVKSREQALSTVLCMDISGSMAANRKLQQAQNASLAFLDRLHPGIDMGLLLFDDQVRDADPKRCVPLAGERSLYPATRLKMRDLIRAAQPEGGTAYLDATAKALQMLGRGSKLSRRAVIVMTDGTDLASKITLDGVIQQALTAQIPVYPIGIGEAGKREVINVVLVLDRSGSMLAKASDTDAQTKIQALHEAASRFVDLTRPNSRTTLLPFSTDVDTPRPPSSNKEALKRQIREIAASGGTRLYDAILDGVDTVAATSKEGKRAVVVLTDGKDEAPGSRAGPIEIVRRAKEEQVTIYTIGLGRDNDINKPVLEQLARGTNGQFYHARNQQSLVNLFEKLSLDLYDDGIDEESLERLARGTGGKYYPVKDAARLELLFPELARDLEDTYSVTFRSRRQLHDGTARGIALSVVRGGATGATGERVSNVAETSYAVRGLVVVPEVDPLVYLVLLVGLLVLFALPSLLKSRTPSA